VSREPIRPLVLGAGGLLGRALVARLEEEFPEAVGATRAEIDLLDRFRMEAEIERLEASVIINCAAWTDVEGCTRDPARAREVNAEGAENAARAAAGCGGRIVQISTDFVFDGRKGSPYVEADPPGPLSAYGVSKLEGEMRVAVACPDHLIVRTAWLYGEGGGDFVGKILRAASGDGPLRVVHDERGSPSYADDVAEGIARLLRVPHRGVVHLVNRGGVSRLEFARAILEEAGLASRVRVLPTAAAELSSPTVRPADATLDTSLYSRLTGHEPRPWRDALDDFLAHHPPISVGH
jgi:dTDP-4-dehydrorhamnose reductase